LAASGGLGFAYCIPEYQLVSTMKAAGLSANSNNIKEVYSQYETVHLGNSSLNSLNYGLLASNENGYISINENNETILNANESENIIATGVISQINIADDYVFYRGKDKKLYASQHNGVGKNLIIDKKIATVLLVGDEIYFVDYGDNKLYKCDLTGNNIQLVLDAEVKTFTIVGNLILYLDYSHNLYLYDMNNSSLKWKNENVFKFYFNGKVYVQNNDKIICFNINNCFAKEIVSGITEFFCVNKDSIYYTIGNKLYSQNLDTGTVQELGYNFKYYKGVYVVNDNLIVFGGE